jgi:uncharacterized membrane protein
MQKVPTMARGILGFTFIVAGLNHFWNPKWYRAIMPPYLPHHALLVDLSGYAEILLGLMVFVPRWARVTRWGLIALLLAVFPANLHMALNPDRYSQIPLWLLWVRLPLQAVFAVWVWRVVRPRK